jgi:hypothetical protein
MAAIIVNGVKREVQAPPDTPLLYVLKNDLELSSPKFGSGMAQCGSCSVLLDGKEIRSCITPLSAVGTKEVTTLEGLSGAIRPMQSQSSVDRNGLHSCRSDPYTSNTERTRAWRASLCLACGRAENSLDLKGSIWLPKRYTKENGGESGVDRSSD